MKTATIDYADFEALLAGAMASIMLTEAVLPQASVEQKPALEESIAAVKGAVERATKGVTVGVRAQSFQDRLDAMLTAAREKAQR